MRPRVRGACDPAEFYSTSTRRPSRGGVGDWTGQFKATSSVWAGTNRSGVAHVSSPNFRIAVFCNAGPCA